MYGSKDEYSELEDHLRMADHIFGKEWFYGHGTLSRWRPGEKEKAQARIDTYLTKFEKECMSKLQKAIRIKAAAGGFKALHSEVGSV